MGFGAGYLLADPERDPYGGPAHSNKPNILKVGVMELTAGQTVHYYMYERDYTAEVVAVRGRWFKNVLIERRDGVRLAFDLRDGVWRFLGGPAVLFDGEGPTARKAARKAERRAAKASRRALETV